MNIRLNTKYYTGPLANTELHAGGLLFGSVYRNCIEFRENGLVLLTKELIDPFRPMDPQDLRHINEYNIQGHYLLNDRGYLVCVFEDLFLTYTGMLNGLNMIVFHVYDSRLLQQWGTVFQQAD